MTPPDRRSRPDGFERKSSLAELYPTAKDSDPRALKDLIMRHARRHEQALETFIAHNERLGEIEEMARKLDERDDALEKTLNTEFTQLKEMVTSGFAQNNLERAVDRTQIKSTLATVAAVWGILVVIIGAAAHFLLQPSCKDTEAMISGRCVQLSAVQVQVK